MPDAQVIAQLDGQVAALQAQLHMARANLYHWKAEVKQIEKDIARLKRAKKDELKRKT